MRLVFGDMRQMGRAIDHLGANPAALGRRMAAKVPEIASADPPQQVEIDYDARLLDSLLFGIFVDRQ
jgi:hypothetical protein